MARTPPGPSQHPGDELIRELIATGREATADDVQRIVERMATAPFDPRLVSPPADLQGQVYLGRTVQHRDESLFVHLVKRVLDERQWAHGTTEAEYIDHLRHAVQHPEARLAAYSGRSGPISASVSRTEAIVPAGRLGEAPLPFLIVVYSADRCVLITGYQFSDLSRVRIPKEALWLK